MSAEPNVEVNVEKIMQELRMRDQMEEDLKGLPIFEDIPVKAGAAVAGAGTGLNLARYEHSLQYLNACYDIPYYWSFGPMGIKTLFKRAVRKVLKCLIPPILEKQNRINAHVVSCLNSVKTLIIHADSQSEEIALLKKELADYQKETEKRIQEMMRLIEQKETAQ